ncbi:hypothetical protein [Pontibacter brevis]
MKTIMRKRSAFASDKCGDTPNSTVDEKAAENLSFGNVFRDFLWSGWRAG